MRGYHRPVRLSDLQPDGELSLDLDDPLDLHNSFSRRHGNADSTRGGEYFFVQPSSLTAASGLYGGQSGGQRDPAGFSECNPCPIETQEEPHQDCSSLSASKNETAACDGDDPLRAKPHFGLQPRRSVQIDGENEASNLDIPVSYEERLVGRVQTPILHDTSVQSRDPFLPLYQLPSVSSLSEHEADLGPSPPPLAQKLRQNNRSAQLSLEFDPDVGASQPRHLGGRTRGRGDRSTSSLAENNLSQSALAQREVIQTSPVRANGRPASTPGLRSPFPPKHDWSRRPEQISSSRDPAALRLSPSPMEKLKNVGRFRRISMGPDQPDYKSEQPRKHFKLSGIFSRHQHRKSAPPQPILESSSEGSTRHYLAPTSSRPDSRIASSSISSFDHHERPISLPDARNTYTNGRRQPTEGFFAHESPESFTVAKAHPPHLRGAASSDRIRMSDPTPIDPRRLSPHSPPYPPRHPHVSSSPRLGSPLPTATSSPIPRTPPSRGRSEERTYAQDLHLRSRSPKAFAPRPEERTLPKHDTTDPAYKLGAFRSSNPRTSRSGDQELPWKITIPGEEDTEPTTTTSTSASWRQETEEILNVTRLPTYQEDEEEYGAPALAQQPLDEKRRPPLSEHPAMLAPTSHPNPNLNLNLTSNPDPNPNPTSLEHPHRSGARTINAVDAPVELPVRTDDNSSEEIMMSSTAYPGQEWRPLGFSEWDHQ